MNAQHPLFTLKADDKMTAKERKEQIADLIGRVGVAMKHSDIARGIGLKKSPYVYRLLEEMVEDDELVTGMGELTNGVSCKLYALAGWYRG